MSQIDPTHSSRQAPDFAAQAEGASPGLLRELFDFLRSNKKWWLAPIIIVLLLLGVVVLLTSSVAAPFVYTLF